MRITSLAMVGAVVLGVAGLSTAARAWDAPLCAVDDSLVNPPAGLDALDEPSMCTSWGAETPYGHVEREVVGNSAARRALSRARQLRGQHRYAEALLQLNVVEHGFPRLIDRISILRGELHLDALNPREARRAFEVAIEGPDSRVRALGRVGRVRAFIAEGHRDAASELTNLLRRYPHLPQTLELRYVLARSKERRADINGAVRIYRDIDMSHPGSLWAARARARMDHIRGTGERVRDLTLAQQVERAERLVRQGPMDQARTEVERLLEVRLTPQLSTTVHLSAARIARIEGRWDDARRHTNRARSGRIVDAEARQTAMQQAVDAAAAARAREVATARSQIQQFKGGRTWRRVPHARLRAIVEIAARAGLIEEVNQALSALSRATRAHPNTLFDAAVLASGVGDDTVVAELFGRVAAVRRFRVSAGYHQARALERLGRYEEAEALLVQVIESDRGATRYYSMWARQRLDAVRYAIECRCTPTVAEQEVAAGGTRTNGRVLIASLEGVADSGVQRAPERRAEGTAGDSLRLPELSTEEADLRALAARLAPLVEGYGESYPWIPRARDLLLLGEAGPASDEIHEAFVAWREASGRPLRRTGLEAVYRGDEGRPRVAVSWQTRRQRRQLTREARTTLAGIATELGDEGTASGFLGPRRIGQRPRAYEAIAREAAHRHGLDPNLLLAVMRVESVYQRRIVSYAGAVGLMQIMPRTGRLIANKLGRDDFTTADLLNPETNLDFAAWYLASLIERFDGHLPLAIASYNGGPHNVRRWIRNHGEDMTLDAFLERIPFSQTHRYVRRVLTHYAAYREQVGLPMESLSVELPQPAPDRVSF